MGGGGLGDLDSDDETMGTYQGSMSTVKGVSGGPEDGEDYSRISRALFGLYRLRNVYHLLSGKIRFEIEFTYARY